MEGSTVFQSSSTSTCTWMVNLHRGLSSTVCGTRVTTVCVCTPHPEHVALIHCSECLVSFTWTPGILCLVAVEVPQLVEFWE